MSRKKQEDKQILVSRVMSALHNASIPELMLLAADMTQETAEAANESTGFNVISLATRIVSMGAANSAIDSLPLKSISIGNHKLDLSVFLKIAMSFVIYKMLEEAKKRATDFVMKYRRNEISKKYGVHLTQSVLKVVVNSKQQPLAQCIIKEMEAAYEEDLGRHQINLDDNDDPRFPNPSTEPQRGFYLHSNQEGNLLLLKSRRMIPHLQVAEAADTWKNDIADSIYQYVLSIDHARSQLQGDDRALLDLGLCSLRNKQVRFLENVGNYQSKEEAITLLHQLESGTKSLLENIRETLPKNEEMKQGAYSKIAGFGWGMQANTTSNFINPYTSPAQIPKPLKQKKNLKQWFILLLIQP